MQVDNIERAVLLLSCPDTKGIVADVSNFISSYNGNILDFDQHSDAGGYFMRVEWDIQAFTISPEDIGAKFQPIAEKFSMDFRLEFTPRSTPTAIFVSSYSHCLYDLILRNNEGQSRADIRCMISNHPQMEKIADMFAIPFHYIAMDNKQAAEHQQLDILDNAGVKLIVLARYMQILSADFVQHYSNRIINIHHSFLPAFKGARPYHQAYERGVKIIGASSHYVTADLDQGPIIAQDVVQISHRDSIQGLITKGRDLERRVLTHAVKLHLEHRVLPYGNKTIVFG